MKTKKIGILFQLSILFIVVMACDGKDFTSTSEDTESTLDTILIKDTEDDILYGFRAMEYSNSEYDYKLPFRLYIPENYKEGEKYPLVIFLHGAGRRGNDNVSQIKDMSGPLAFVNHEVQKKYPSFVLAPQSPIGENWIGQTYSGERVALSLEDVKPSPINLMLLDLLQKIQVKYDIDSDRIYLTGQSMGGIGTWYLALMNPNEFAAIAPICGRSLPSEVSAIVDLPIWAFHGAEDKTILPEESRKMVKALKEAGSNKVKYTEYPNVGHESWTKAYTEDTDNDGEVDLIKWMFSKKRE